MKTQHLGNELRELIDFTTHLQVINMEKKSAVIEVVDEGKKGYVAFENGEIIDAKLGKRQGERIAKHLIIKNPKKFKVLINTKVKKRTVNIPIMAALLDATIALDELKYKTDHKRNNINNNIDSLLINIMENRFLEELKNSKGFDGCFVFNENDDLIWEIKEEIFKNNINLQKVNVFLNNTKIKLYEKTDWAFSNYICYMSKGYLFCYPLNFDNKTYNMILFFNSYGNIVLIQNTINKFVESL